MNLARVLPLTLLLALAPAWPGADSCAPLFNEAARLPFVLRNDASKNKHQIETMAGGVAAFDYNNDGLPDLYFVNGARQPALEKTGPEWWNRLYRNKGNFQFEDVTEQAGVAGAGYQIAAATGDYNNDGNVDLFVAGVNRDILYRNRGNGTFEDVTIPAGLGDRRIAGKKPWSVTAVWFDYDRDGWLDLFVVNYVKWDSATETMCGDQTRQYRTYCHPRYYEGLPNNLYRNNRDGTFTDVSEPSGIARHTGKGMGAAFADYDGDGDPDLFAANDTTPNFLFRNDGNGRFTEVGLRAGVAFNDDGRAASSMGADFRDIDNDGRPDLFVSALANETFPVFLNTGSGLFVDATYRRRVGPATLAMSGWSNAIVDVNNDGWKDLVSANGDVQDNTELFSSRKSKQPNLVLMGGAAHYAPCFFGAPAQHRGLAVADFDRDGRMDLVVTRIGETAAVYRNVSAAQQWLVLRLIGSQSNRDGIGAEIRIGTQWNQASTSVGYASASDRVVPFGFGADGGPKRAEIRWPSGKVLVIESVKPGQYLEVREPQ